MLNKIIAVASVILLILWYNLEKRLSELEVDFYELESEVRIEEPTIEVDNNLLYRMRNHLFNYDIFFFFTR